MALVRAPVAYLDTNHISRLARFPAAPDVQEALGLIDGRRAVLGVSIVHLIELSAPEFVDREAVGELLDSLPLAWAKHPHELWRDELLWAYAKAMGTPAGLAVFFDSMEAAWHHPAASVAPSVALEAFAENPDLRQQMFDARRYAFDLDVMKAGAAVVRDRRVPLLLALRDLNLRVTPGGLFLPAPLDPGVILDRAGGPDALPTYDAYQRLHIARLADTRFGTEENDLVDELHVCYGPHAAALLVDRRTFGRMKTGKISFMHKVGRSLADLPRLLGSSTPAEDVVSAGDTADD